MEPRVKLLRLGDLDGDARAAYDEFVDDQVIVGPRDSNTALTAHAGVLLYNPGVFRGANVSGHTLMRSSGVPARDRELVMLRTAWLCQAPVVWSNHTGHAHDAGMTADEVERITVGPDAEGWTGHEQALLRMVDQLHESANVSDDVWSVLDEHYAVSQIVALPMLVALDHTMCFLFNALRVPPPDPARRPRSALT